MESSLTDRDKQELAERIRSGKIILKITAGFILLAILIGIFTITLWINFAPPLIGSALSTRNEAELKQALERLPDSLEAKDKFGKPPFLAWVWHGDEWAVAALIRHGANVHAHLDNGVGCDRNWNALHLIAANGRVKLADLLLKAGVDINEKSKLGKTPLDLALEREHFDVAAFYRANGGKRGNELP